MESCTNQLLDAQNWRYTTHIAGKSKFDKLAPKIATNQATWGTY